jgi:hypothetical protein
MPVTHLLRNDVLIFKARGEVSVADFYDAWKDVKAVPSFHLPIDLLVDLREAHVDLPGQEIEAVVYDLKRNRFFNKMVFVAERGSFTYAMGRMFCINAECAGCCSEIFLAMPDALAWLEGDSINSGTPPPIPLDPDTN